MGNVLAKKRGVLFALVALMAPAGAMCYAVQKQEEAPANLEVQAKSYERACIQNLRTINVAQGVYQGGDESKGFARTLRELGPAKLGALDASVASGTYNDYKFRLTAEHRNPVRHYALTARPLKRLTRNQRSFFTDETGIVRFTTEDRAATKADPPITE